MPPSSSVQWCLKGRRGNGSWPWSRTVSSAQRHRTPLQRCAGWAQPHTPKGQDPYRLWREIMRQGDSYGEHGKPPPQKKLVQHMETKQRGKHTNKLFCRSCVLSGMLTERSKGWGIIINNRGGNCRVPHDTIRIMIHVCVTQPEYNMGTTSG